MSSFENELMPGERVLAVCKKNWTFFLNRRCLIGIVLAFIFISVPQIALIILVIAFAPTVLEYNNTELVLTNTRLRGKKGAFKIATVENKASYFVGNVRTQSNVILSMLGSETIIIESKGVERFVFTHMKNAQKMSSALYSLGNGNELYVVNRF